MAFLKHGQTNLRIVSPGPRRNDVGPRCPVFPSPWKESHDHLAGKELQER